MFTVFTDGAALLRLVHRVDTLRDGTVGHHTVHLIIWFATAPFTGRRLRAEGRNAGSGSDQSGGFTHMNERVCLLNASHIILISRDRLLTRLLSFIRLLTFSCS